MKYWRLRSVTVGVGCLRSTCKTGDTSVLDAYSVPVGVGCLPNGNFPDVELLRLKEGLEKLKHTDAYENYGTPFTLGVWEKLLA